MTGPELTEEDAITLGAALSDLVESEGWKLLTEILRRRENEWGRYGMRDTEKSRDYYLGRMDEAIALIHDVERVTAYAREARQRLEAENRVQVRPRLGGGSLA